MPQRNYAAKLFKMEEPFRYLKSFLRGSLYGAAPALGGYWLILGAILFILGKAVAFTIGPFLLIFIGPPILIAALIGGAYTLFKYLSDQSEHKELIEHPKNPTVVANYMAIKQKLSNNDNSNQKILSINSDDPETSDQTFLGMVGAAFETLRVGIVKLFSKSEEKEEATEEKEVTHDKNITMTDM